MPDMVFYFTNYCVYILFEINYCIIIILT